MTKYDKIKTLSPEQFRRLTGVKRTTFDCMVAVLQNAVNKRYKSSGRRGLLTLEDKLLMTLEYLREYRTYFHLSQSYGLCESACYRACRWVEDTLSIGRSILIVPKRVLTLLNF